jgi:hypothetical protein
MATLEKKLAQIIVELIDEVVKLHPKLEEALNKVRSLLKETEDA